MKNVKLNMPLIADEIKRAGITQGELSVMIGKDKTYLSCVKTKHNSMIPENMERIICMMLGKEAGYFILDEIQADRKPSGNEAQILVNITVRIKELSEKADMILTKISEMDEQQEKIYSKVHANTLQLEKVKESTRELKENLHLTNTDKAERFLRETLSGGRMNGEEILMMADARGIKRADLNKAKRDMRIDTATTGYGKSQKTWWMLPE